MKKGSKHTEETRKKMRISDKNRKYKIKRCLICGKKFQPLNGIQKRCSSRECYLEKERKRSKERYKNPEYRKKAFERCRKYAKSQKGKDYIWKWHRIKKGTWNTPCEICGEKRFIERCHIIRKKETTDNFLYLCPTHHKILDNWLLKSRGNQFTKDEYNKIKNKIGLLITPRLI